MGLRLPDDRSREVSVHVRPPAMAFLYLARGAAVMFILLAVSYAGLLVFATGRGLGMMVPAGVVAVGVACVVTPYLRRREDARNIGAVRLKHDRCAACGYSLVGVEPEQDGCRVCPECGGAWRAGRAPRATER
jgi:hypothetical protein